MKNFNFLRNLFSPAVGWQSNDVSVDCRLTVGSPSGFGSKSLLKLVSVLVLILTIGVGQMWATTGTLTLSSSNKFGTSSGSTKNDNQGNTWTCTCLNIQNSYQTTYSGQQFGTGSSPADATFTCTIAGATISSVKATMATGAGGTYTIKVGGVTKYSGSLTTTATEYGGTDATGTGEIEIKITKGTKASYLGQIVVVYTTAPAVAHTVTYNAGTGSCKASEAEASAGVGVTLPTPTHSCYSEGWSFAGWTTGALITTETDEAPATLYSGGSNYKPAADITLYAVYQKGDGLYHLVTTLPTGEDIPGDYMIVNTSAQKALDAYVVSSYYLDADATGSITSNAINPENVDYFSYNHWKVTYEFSKWIFYNESQKKYLYNYNSTYKNLGITGTKPAGYTVSLSGGYAVFASADVSGAYIYYDSSNNRFAGNSTTKNLHLYKLEEATYYSNPTCCTALGSINGSVSLTQGGTSVTVKDWGAVTNAGKYTVKCYEYNEGTSTWGLKATQENITNRSTGATFSSLTLNAKYKFSVQAIATDAAYCDGDETDVTTINSTSVTSTPFQLRYAIHIDDANNDNWVDYWLDPTANDDEGSVEITLSGPRNYYQFQVKGGWNGWWGQTGTSTIPADTEWTLNGGSNVRLQTWIGGTYTFTVDLSGTNPKVTITFPPANQAAGKIVYWDASIHGNNWTKLIFRVGTDANSNAGSDCKVSGQLVPGTDQFYKVTTAAFNNMRAWAIANNAGWTGSQTNGVYRTNDFGDYNVTKSTQYQDYVVGNDGVTLIPSSSGTIGDKSYNNNCYFYPVTKTDGMLTHNVAVAAKPTGGSITVTYTNTSGTGGQTVTDGNNADLAHRCILNVIATPETGYNLATFTKNAAAFAGGNYILTEDVTFAATFSLKTTTVTLNNHGATTAGATSVTATYSQAVPSIAANLPAKTGYEFHGYFTGENGEGTKYINADGTSANNWLIEDATTTLHAYWTPKRCTVTLTAGTGTNGEAKYDYDATTYFSFTPAVRVGYTCNGYWTGSGGTGTKILNADGSRAANVAGWWVDGKWAKDATSATLYAGWTNTYGGDEFELVLDLSELSAGKKIIIMNAGHDKALSTTQNTNNRGQVLANADGGFTMSGDNNVATLKAATTVQVITLESTGTANRYYLNVEDGYLYAPGTSSNYYLKTRANNSSNAEQGQFNFALSNGDFTISAQSSTNNYLRHNNGNSLFSCYNTASSQNPVLVYVKRESCDDPANALSLSASPTAVSTATGHNTSTLSVNGGNGNAVTYRVISDNKANATISGTTTKTFSATVAGTYTVQAFQLKNDNICRQIATTDITVTTPVLTTSKNSHTFEKTKTGSSRTTNTVTVSGANLVGDVSVTYTGHTAYFTVTPSSISASDAMSSAQALTITYAPTVAGSHSITITISSTGAEDKTVTVNGTAADFYDVTFHISGSSDEVRSVESGQKPVLPDAPASCDATSTAFIGWATEPWVGKIASVAGKTIHTSNTTMPAVTTATHYYAVWANEETESDEIVSSLTATALSGSNSTTWVTINSLDAPTTDATYKIYSMGTYKAGTNPKQYETYVMKWSASNGYLQTNSVPSSGNKLLSVTVQTQTGIGNKSVGVYGSNNGSDWTSCGSLTATEAGGTYEFTSSYTWIKLTGAASSSLLESVTITYGSYTDYLTTCCENTGLTFGTRLSPVTSYEIVRTSSAAATIDCNFESSTATAITWYKTSRAARTFVTPTGATSSTAPSSQLAEMTIDMSNKKLTASSVGVYTITIKQDEATIAGQKYCESFAEVTVTVKVRDRFVDLMNGVAVDADDGNPTITKDDTGGGIYTPTESEFSEDDICKSTRRKLIGWIKESDLNTGYAGRVNDITDMKTDNPATNKVIAPNTQVEATGCTWYAVWADID